MYVSSVGQRKTPESTKTLRASRVRKGMKAEQGYEDPSPGRSRLRGARETVQTVGAGGGDQSEPDAN